MNWPASVDSLLSWYQDPMFWLFPMGTLAVSTGTFLLFAIPYTLVAWFDPPSLRRYKVQDTPFDIAKWLWPSLGRLAFNVMVVAVVLVLIWPLLRLSPIHQGEMPAWYVVFTQLGFFILLDDFLYYWMHRTMHKGWLALRQYEATDGHCGYVFPWNPGHVIPLYEGAGYHDFHHAKYQGNYAGFLPYLDRFWNTYARGYLAWRQARRSAR